MKEHGDFELDGVAFPAAEILLDFVDPGDDSEGSVFPTGSVTDLLEVPGHGEYLVTLISSGIPTVFSVRRILVILELASRPHQLRYKSTREI